MAAGSKEERAEAGRPKGGGAVGSGRRARVRASGLATRRPEDGEIRKGGAQGGARRTRWKGPDLRGKHDREESRVTFTTTVTTTPRSSTTASTWRLPLQCRFSLRRHSPPASLRPVPLDPSWSACRRRPDALMPPCSVPSLQFWGISACSR
uniref:Uncharacterized protein n=1 Tax=Arundo donax TaxID=35708 RepID=A0A0A8ZAX2_ARUDO